MDLYEYVSLYSSLLFLLNICLFPYSSSVDGIESPPLVSQCLRQQSLLPAYSLVNSSVTLNYTALASESTDPALLLQTGAFVVPRGWLSGSPGMCRKITPQSPTPPPHPAGFPTQPWVSIQIAS